MGQFLIHHLYIHLSYFIGDDLEVSGSKNDKWQENLEKETDQRNSDGTQERLETVERGMLQKVPTRSVRRYSKCPIPSPICHPLIGKRK